MRAALTPLLWLACLASGNALSQPQDRHFDSDGVAIRYVDQGRGPAVVLVHGYTSDLESQWIATGVLQQLAAEFRVIAFDCRGHGRSDKPHDPGSYGPQMGLDIVRLLDHLGLERAHVVGYSMGAHIVAQLLTTHPHRFESATLGGGAGRRKWTAVDDLRVQTEAAEIEAGMLRMQILRLTPPSAPAPTDSQIAARSAQILAGQDRRALAAVRRSNPAQAVTDSQLSRIAVPLLGIVGSADPYLADLRSLQSLQPRMQLAIVDGATHDTAPAHPEFIRALRRFLSAHSPQPQRPQRSDVELSAVPAA
ncbi:MAG TPA: alpha/beta hydrolase [Burkholderiaceae bacterium]|nr:alpha/beta hydrolase [Burkholderiaceae bacterium]